MKYDIVIAGGGTAGCAAAYTAGLAGKRVLLIEKNIHLGGSITSGLVIPAMKCGKHQINTEFFEALISELKSMGGQITYQDNPGWFNPELTKIALDNLLAKANVDVLFGTTIQNVTIINSSITSVSILNKNLSSSIDKLHRNKKALSVPVEKLYKNNKLLLPPIDKLHASKEVLFEPIEAMYFIDATGNCDFAKICNCNFLENKNQPLSLRFIMSGIDMKKFGEWLVEFDKDRDVTTVEEIDGETHLSTAYTWDEGKVWALKPLFDRAVEEGILKDYDRNYFQLFTIPGMPGSAAFNCPRIVTEADALSVFDTSKALLEGRQSIFRLANFCKKYLPGFEKAFISNIADTLGIRVSRRIKGKYIYTIDDIKTSKKFDNPVLVSDYPIDVHSSKKDSSTLEMTAEYQLPVESLMSADIDNLFVIGRCISADFMAQGALRVQPSCFSMGVGLAKYLINKG